MSSRNKDLRLPKAGVNAPRFIRREVRSVRWLAVRIGPSLRASLTAPERPLADRQQEAMALFKDVGVSVARHREGRRARQLIVLLAGRHKTA